MTNHTPDFQVAKMIQAAAAESIHSIYAKNVLFRAGYLVALEDVAVALGWHELADNIRHLAEERKQQWDEAVVRCNQLSQSH